MIFGMRWPLLLIVAASVVFGFCRPLAADDLERAFLGFDRNQYPGDSHLAELHKTFAYVGFWLNTPPGATTNTWTGRRSRIEGAGFGFLVLFNGRLYRQLGNEAHASSLGKSDAEAAIRAAKREGFPPQTVIFLDQEQGGRLLPEQKIYLFAWVDGVSQSGFRAGVYCSGIAFEESPGVSIITALDVRQNAGRRNITYWVTNDACPPSRGCAAGSHTPLPKESGIGFADVWQFAQSPRRKDVAAHCQGYDHDGSCYAPTSSSMAKFDVDLNSSTSDDPSHGRTGKQ
jgi:Domain of unknown function (DUF1906)